ncbi:MAG: hypothetical protein RL199_455 [Pseudomonadota bacterium]
MPAASHPHRRVLVVEDTTDIRELLVDILSGEGYGVEACANGAEALARLSAGRYDLVLLDLMMPVMDGLQLLEELRRSGGQPPPVVVMSAFERFRGEVAELGARAFISKPVDIDRLLDAVARHLVPAGG